MTHTENLPKKINDVIAIENLNIDIHEGGLFGFLGPNGAGKTTTIRMLTCQIKHTSRNATMIGFMLEGLGNQKTKSKS